MFRNPQNTTKTNVLYTCFGSRGSKVRILLPRHTQETENQSLFSFLQNLFAFANPKINYFLLNFGVELLNNCSTMKKPEKQHGNHL